VPPFPRWRFWWPRLNKAKRNTSLLLGGAVIAAAGGVALQQLLRDGNQDAPSLDSLWKWPFQDLGGSEKRLDLWRGKVLVVNFWATWCEPCREEVPTLVKMQAKYAANGLQVVGISLDSVAKVQEFAREYKVQYPLLIASLDVMNIARNLGNKAAGLPYTLVLNRDGVIQTRHLGGISERQLESAIAPWLEAPPKST
jgi:thiol-disulfide isomerase/thioredoxin